MKDPEASQEYRGDVVGIVSQERALGQTFVSRRPRLNGVQLWLRRKPDFPADDRLIVELYKAVGDPQPLASTAFSSAALGNAFPLAISLPPQDAPPGQGYYLVLHTSGGQVEVFGRNEDAYPYGEMLVDGKPPAAGEADFSFRLSYEYDPVAMMGDLGAAAQDMWLVLPLVLLLWAPGRLLLGLVESGPWMKDGRALDWGERAALSLGLSLALLPVLMLWTTSLGLRWSRAGVLLCSALLAAALAWVSWRKRRRARGACLPLRQRLDPTSLALAAVLLLSLGVRLAMARDLAAPAWVDSVHHALLTRLIVDVGGYPQTYAPLVETTTASYHPGYHSLAAAFAWLSGLDLPRSILLLSQALNALSALAVYLFATSLTGSRSAGVIAALVTAAFTPMPAYYASWGRYTQMTGQLALPVCFVLIRHLWQARLSKTRLAALLLVSGIACGGLFLIHYRVIAFLVLLLLAELVARTIRSLDKAPLWQTLPRLLVPLGLAGALAVLVSLPWWPAFISSLLLPQTSVSGAAKNNFSDFAWGYLTSAYGKQAMYLAGLGLAWSLARARWFGATLALWVALLFLLANPGAVDLPGGGLVNNTSVEIMLFMPISVLAGYLSAEVVSAPRRFIPLRGRPVYAAVVGLAGAALALVGARNLLPILNPITFLFREADAPAIAWVAENVPAGETVLTNPFLWGYGLYAGQDGGAWIPALAGRASMPPPVLQALGDHNNARQATEISRQIVERSKDPQALYDLMQAEGVQFIYLGARGGAISAQALRESPLFDLLYARDGVWIFMRAVNGEQ
ncbi:MAG: hypothetical protein JXA78_16550 [Anaerolineales bacterium]|nr:hypothetical protein [Anaerolineales bacterium]